MLTSNDLDSSRMILDATQISSMTPQQRGWYYRVRFVFNHLEEPDEVIAVANWLCVMGLKESRGVTCIARVRGKTCSHYDGNRCYPPFVTAGMQGMFKHQSRKLVYITELPPDYDEDEIRAWCEKKGLVLEIHNLNERLGRDLMLAVMYMSTTTGRRAS